MVIIKNVILYDRYQHVVGFAELKNLDGATQFKVKHNLADADLTLVIKAGDEDFSFKMNKKNFEGTLSGAIDLDGEIIVNLTQKDGDTVTVFASGSLNVSKKPFSKALSTLPPLKSILTDTEKGINRQKAADKEIEKPAASRAAREIDEILRAICSVDDKGKGICETCPYRDYFFGETFSNYSSDLPVRL